MYVHLRKRGGMGRLARANGVPGLRGLRGQFPTKAQAAMLAKHFSLMGYDAAGNYFPDATDIAAGGVSTPVINYAPTPSGGISPGVSQLISQGIATAGGVAAIAVKPPVYSSVSTPYGTSITSYGPLGAGTLGTSQWGLLLSSPVFLLGIGLLVFVVVKR